jgi:hypothetical protein
MAVTLSDEDWETVRDGLVALMNDDGEDHDRFIATMVAARAAVRVTEKVEESR